MGLSSSQARLLSITAKLTDNEYRTQRLTNARLRLSDISESARVDYQEALDSNKFVFMTYDSTGAYVETDLTPAVLWQYQPCKNQYALVNNANNVLVSSTDAKNFRETDNLAEFLKRYDCLEKVFDTKEFVKYHETIKDNPQYYAEEERYAEAYQNWINSKPENETIHIHTDDVYENQIVGYEPGDEIKEPGWTERVHSSELYELLRHNACFQETVSSRDNCYMHVMASLLGPGNHTTTSGQTYHIYAVYDGEMCPDSKCEHGFFWNTDCYGPSKGFTQEVRDYLENRLCCNCEHDGDTVDIQNYWGNGVVYNDIETHEFHCSKADGSPMTAYQKLVDMLWEVHSSYDFEDTGGSGGKVTTDEDKLHYSYFWHFLEFDLDDVTEIEHEPVYWDRPVYGEVLIQEGEDYDTPDPDYLDWKTQEPHKTEYPKTITVTEPETYYEVEDKLVIKDPEKAQWYTNLWYRMNGMDEPERIYRNSTETTNERAEEITEAEYLLTLFDVKKNTYNTCYQEIPSNLASSKSWLNNALAQGWVTMQKVGVSRTTDKDEYKWEHIIYSNATDIITEEDSAAIALAEAKYTQILSETEKKDKMYQMQIRKLDSEHNALQTEYNSVKSALDKNVTRSFKAFQG